MRIALCTLSETYDQLQHKYELIPGEIQTDDVISAIFLPDSFGSHAHLCANTTPNRAVCNRTSSTIVCQMELKRDHNNLLFISFKSVFQKWYLLLVVNGSVFFFFFLVSFVRMSEIMHLICCMCTIQIYFGRSVECCGDGYKTQNLMLLS